MYKFSSVIVWISSDKMFMKQNRLSALCYHSYKWTEHIYKLVRVMKTRQIEKERRNSNTVSSDEKRVVSVIPKWLLSTTALNDGVCLAFN